MKKLILIVSAFLAMNVAMNATAGEKLDAQLAEA
jgi:hypothetical protein